MGDSAPGSEETVAGESTATADAAATSGSRGAAFERGTVVGRYVVLERVGRGGMGIVYAAYDPELDRKVALKVLVPRAAQAEDSVGRRRLVREAQAMAKVTHPNVVTVHDVGEHAGQVFMAMEFVDGTTLGRWLEAEERAPAQVLQMFVHAGRGLAAAHAADLVHRDFKPDNVLVRTEEASGPPQPKVADFGLVRAAAQDDSGALVLEAGPGRTATPAGGNLTRFGQLMGTPSFMAPEQYLHAAVDARTDQFAFCVALWRALFGEHPFGGETVTELAERILSGRRRDAPTGSAVSVRVRKALERGLAVDPDDRWPSMQALLEQLVRAPSPGSRRRWIVLGGVAALGLGLGVQQLVRARAIADCETEAAAIDEVWNDEAQARAREGLLATGLERAGPTFERVVPWLDAYADRWRDARREACVAGDVDGRWEPDRVAAAVDCLEWRLHAVRKLTNSLGLADDDGVDSAVASAADLPRPEGCVEERLLAQRLAPPRDSGGIEEARAINDLLSRVVMRSNVDGAAVALHALDELQPRVDAHDHAAITLRALHLRASLLHEAGDESAAREHYREALAFALRVGASDEAADLAVALAAIHMDAGEFADGLWATTMAEALYGRAGESTDGPRNQQVWHLRAWLHHHQGTRDPARDAAERALELASTHLGESHPRTADSYCLLSTIETSRGELEVAERTARRCLELRKRSQGPGHPRVALALAQLANVLRERGELDDALRAVEEARLIAIPESAGTEKYASLLANLGLVLNDGGRASEAAPLLEEALASARRTLGPTHPRLAIYLLNLGNARQSLGHNEAAVADYVEALRLLESGRVPDARVRGALLSNLANSESLLGRLDDALEHHREALAEVEAVEGVDHPVVASVLLNSREVLVGLGRHEEALEAARRALHIRTGAGASLADQAAAQWALAQSLASLDREPTRATQLAEQALAGYEGTQSPELPKVRLFLEARRAD